ncbi:MAG: hypothetical protein GMKNLPBB_00749 [Myxococcota bacterium]|nr:hypothetical protein [Myxococcota bacterium]
MNGGWFLFVSYDLTNSTQLKQDSPDWPEIFRKFYSFVESDGSLHLRPWKYNGDEVICIGAIPETPYIFPLIELCYSVSNKVNDVLGEWQKEHLPKSRYQLQCKSTAWIGEFGKDASNKVITTSASALPFNQAQAKKEDENDELKSERVPLHDFIGPDMDTGFRLSKHAFSRPVTISVDIALILLDLAHTFQENPRLKGIPDRLYLRGWESLKGVWENRPYPVVWYLESPGTFLETAPYEYILQDKWFQGMGTKPDSLLFKNHKELVEKAITETMGKDYLPALLKKFRITDESLINEEDE